MLSAISIVSGVGAGVLALIASKRTPEKAKELRRLGVFFLCFAGVMTLVAVL